MEGVWTDATGETFSVEQHIWGEVFSVFSICDVPASVLSCCLWRTMFLYLLKTENLCLLSYSTTVFEILWQQGKHFFGGFLRFVTGASQKIYKQEKPDDICLVLKIHFFLISTKTVNAKLPCLNSFLILPILDSPSP